MMPKAMALVRAMTLVGGTHLTVQRSTTHLTVQRSTFSPHETYTLYVSCGNRQNLQLVKLWKVSGNFMSPDTPSATVHSKS